MESQRFDDLTRKVASGVSRRSVLRGALGGALGGAFAALRLGRGAAAQAEKVDICHLTGNGSYRHINVSVNALDAHLAHGDRTADFCEGNFALDFEACDCVCALDCARGYALDITNCQCNRICEAPDLATCSPPDGRCVQDYETGDAICAGVGFAYMECDTPDDCDAICAGPGYLPECGESGWVCAVHSLMPFQRPICHRRLA